MGKFDVVEDDEFTAFVNKVAEEQAEAAARKANGGFIPPDFEDVKWAGLPEKKMEIVRLLGRPPRGTTKLGPYDMHEIHTTEVKDDDGKIMKMNLPTRADSAEENHVMWRLIDAVMRVSYIKDGTGKTTKVYENEIKHPEIFAKVAKAGFDPEKDKNKYQWTKGMMGQRVLIANAIVRSMSDWHKKNNHTVLLSKSVTLSQDGTREFANVGVPSYGFLDPIGEVVSKYGSLEKIDLGITRTAQMNSPYKIINASRMAEKDMMEELDGSGKLVIVGPLTEEELNYDRYDIGKLFKPTSYSKLKRRLGKTIKAIDAALRTNYYDEIAKLAEEEEKERQALKAAEAEAAAVAPAAQAEAPAAQAEAPKVQESAPAAPAAAPVRTRAPAQVIQKDDGKFASLTGWNNLSDEMKAKVLDVETDATGKVTNILYDTQDPTDFEVGCPKCGIGAPQSFSHCPNCNEAF